MNYQLESKFKNSILVQTSVIFEFFFILGNLLEIFCSVTQLECSFFKNAVIQTRDYRFIQQHMMSVSFYC